LLLCISKSPTYLGRHVQAVERGSLWMDVKVTDSPINLVFSVTHMSALGNASTRCDKKVIPWNYLPFSQQPLGISLWNFPFLRDYHIYA